MTISKKLFIGTLSLSFMALAQTDYTGETFLGKKVITNLDVSDLEPGKIHEFYFQTSENSLGKPWFIPVSVIKGKQEGRSDLSHPVHVDNCILEPETRQCWREAPAFTHRDLRCTDE